MGWSVGFLSINFRVRCKFLRIIVEYGCAGILCERADLIPIEDHLVYVKVLLAAVLLKPCIVHLANANEGARARKTARYRIVS